MKYLREVNSKLVLLLLEQVVKVVYIILAIIAVVMYTLSLIFNI